MLFLNALFLNTGKSVSFSWQTINTSLFVAESVLSDQAPQKRDGFNLVCTVVVVGTWALKIFRC